MENERFPYRPFSERSRLAWMYIWEIIATPEEKQAIQARLEGDGRHKSKGIIFSNKIRREILWEYAQRFAPPLPEDKEENDPET